MAYDSAFSFPLGEIIDASELGTTSVAYLAYEAQLGSEVLVHDRDEGVKVYRMVKAAGTLSSVGKTYAGWNDATEFKVDQAGAATDIISGCFVDGQDDAAADDLLWIQVDGHHTVTDSGSGVTKDDNLEAATGGKAATATVTVAELATGKVISRALATASADADITAAFLRKCS